jgi:hypothetical protein
MNQKKKLSTKLNSGIYTWNIQYHLECDVCFQYQER